MHDVRFDTISRPFRESLKSKRLILFDHLGTTFYEAMALNCPCILFFDRQLHPLKKNAALVFEDLQNAGILFDTPETAALAAEHAYGDVETWWMSPIRQRARRLFCDELCRYSDTWSAEWLDVFREMAAQSRGIANCNDGNIDG